MRRPQVRVQIRWRPDGIVELHAQGEAKAVMLAASHFAASLAPRVETVEHDVGLSLEKQDRWAKAGKAWVFIIGLATVAGGVAAVLALMIH
jgi:hypothetical protein